MISIKDMKVLDGMIETLAEQMENEIFDKILEIAEQADEKDCTTGRDELYQEVRDLLKEYQDNLQNTIDSIEQIYSTLSE